MKKIFLLITAIAVVTLNSFAQNSKLREPIDLSSRLQKASESLKTTANNNIQNGNFEVWVEDSIESASGDTIRFVRPDLWAPINGLFVAYFLDLNIPISAELNGTNTAAKIEIADLGFGSDLATIVATQARPLTLSGEYKFDGADQSTAFFDVYATKFNPAADSSEIVGSGFFKVDANTTGGYQNFLANIDYIDGTVVPDTVYIFVSYFEGEMGTSLSFDNLSLGYTSTGVNAVKKNDLKVYPNPSNNIIKVQLSNKENLKDAHVEVRSLDGRLLMQINNYQSNESIDISDLATGMYLLNVQDARGVRSQKIQKI